MAVDLRVPHRQIQQTNKKDAVPPDEPDEVEAKLLPIPSCQDECECHHCGEPWNDGDDWTVHVIEKQSDKINQSIGNLYKYECPACECKTFQRVSGVTTDNKY